MNVMDCRKSDSDGEKKATKQNLRNTQSECKIVYIIFYRLHHQTLHIEQQYHQFFNHTIYIFLLVSASRNPIYIALQTTIRYCAQQQLHQRSLSTTYIMLYLSNIVSHVVARLSLFQVIAFICGVIVVLLMIMGLASTDWLMALGWRQGLFAHCIEEGAPTPLPFNMLDPPGCYQARDVGQYIHITIYTILYMYIHLQTKGVYIHRYTPPLVET